MFGMWKVGDYELTRPFSDNLSAFGAQVRVRVMMRIVIELEKTTLFLGV
jgi:hypothetical protein